MKSRIKCQLVTADKQPKEPGDMWYVENMPKRTMAKSYLETWKDIRKPIAIMMPNMLVWNIDQGRNDEDGWTITGDSSNLTATPSIMIDNGVVDNYHGWLRNEYLEEV